jgi:hypothetical protein
MHSFKIRTLFFGRSYKPTPVSQSTPTTMFQESIFEFVFGLVKVKMARRVGRVGAREI